MMIIPNKKMTNSFPIQPKKLHCDSCSSRAGSIFCGLTREHAKYIDQNKTTSVYRKGHILFHEDQPAVGQDQHRQYQGTAKKDVLESAETKQVLPQHGQKRRAEHDPQHMLFAANLDVGEGKYGEDKAEIAGADDIVDICQRGCAVWLQLKYSLGA